MSSMEQIVRPFQSPFPLATRRIVVRDRGVVREDAIIQWGQAGSVPAATEETPEAGGGFKVEACCKDVNTETKRETEQVRVENPKDPSQFVIIERIKKIAFGLDRSNVCLGESSATARAFAEFDANFDSGVTGPSKPQKCEASFELSNT
jgi:hypothetical protein